MLGVSLAANVILASMLLVEWRTAASDPPTGHATIDVEWAAIPRVVRDNPRSITDVGLAHDRTVVVRYDGVLWLKAHEPMLGDTNRLIKTHDHIVITTE